MVMFRFALTLTPVFGECIPNLSDTVYGGSHLDVTRVLAQLCYPTNDAPP